MFETTVEFNLVEHMCGFAFEPPLAGLPLNWSFTPYARVVWTSFDAPNPFLFPGLVARRDMLTRLLVRLNGETLLSAEFQNGTATNPYHVFFVRMEKPSHFEFIWTDDKGRQARAEARVAVV